MLNFMKAFEIVFTIRNVVAAIIGSLVTAGILTPDWALLFGDVTPNPE